MLAPTCHHVTLAKNDIAHVQQCTECECVSIHLGTTTVRIDALALEELWAVLGEAAATLYAQRNAKLGALRGFA
ncbi:hypothetical protein [Polyangium sorediatum]|uniref:Uncharacterized protein n=1 Tax=Polyangium sorediatum TaxID=889274 RepID=A0ABT6P5I3_9BACT|nr:hypothetical protein [Polyangium sorediatum]MDI1435796.1 hypothetical protein [Polyangium sorediatum]